MKITTTNWQNKEIELTVEDAVNMAVNDAWADGELERTKERIDNAAKVVSKIAAVLVDKGILSAADLREILPYRVDVEE